MNATATETAPKTAKPVKTTETKPYDWREDMKKAGQLKDRATTSNRQAGERLWKACKAGIAEWMPTGSDDVSGEALYKEFIEAYGESRKGDCSKMKTVALAARNHGLLLGAFENLSKAYAEARRLTQTVQNEADEDNAAEQAVEAIAAEAPSTASTPANAAKIVLATGVDEAARLLLDALNGPSGENNVAAHRAFLRAVSSEIAGRVKPKVSAVKDEPKEGAEQAKVTPTKAKAAPKTAPTKAKPKAAPTKATPKAATVKAEAASETLAEKAEAKGVTPNDTTGDDGTEAPTVKRPVVVKSNVGQIKRAKPVQRA